MKMLKVARSMKNDENTSTLGKKTKTLSDQFYEKLKPSTCAVLQIYSRAEQKAKRRKNFQSRYLRYYSSSFRKDMTQSFLRPQITFLQSSLLQKMSLWNLIGKCTLLWQTLCKALQYALATFEKKSHVYPLERKWFESHWELWAKFHWGRDWVAFSGMTGSFCWNGRAIW